MLQFFFVAGFALCFELRLIAEKQRGDEYRRIEELKKEASSFYYKTMRELYEGTYNPDDGYVNTNVLETFEKYRPKLEPKCHLGKIEEACGSFYGYAYFPTEEAFDVTMKKIDNEWVLTHFKGIEKKSF